MLSGVHLLYPPLYRIQFILILSLVQIQGYSSFLILVQLRYKDTFLSYSEFSLGTKIQFILIPSLDTQIHTFPSYSQFSSDTRIQFILILNFFLNTRIQFILIPSSDTRIQFFLIFSYMDTIHYYSQFRYKNTVLFYSQFSLDTRFLVHSYFQFRLDTRIQFIIILSLDTRILLILLLSLDQIQGYSSFFFVQFRYSDTYFFSQLSLETRIQFILLCTVYIRYKDIVHSSLYSLYQIQGYSSFFFVQFTIQ